VRLLAVSHDRFVLLAYERVLGWRFKGESVTTVPGAQTDERDAELGVAVGLALGRVRLVVLAYRSPSSMPRVLSTTNSASAYRSRYLTSTSRTMPPCPL
jgi:hypothetical protein